MSYTGSVRWMVAVAVVACGSPPAAVAPSNREVAPSQAPDSDGDGIADDRDRCPDKPEDYDGFEDQDGCPDPDNDGDGVLDADDDCPYDAGPFNGCPKPCKVYITDSYDCFADPSVFYDEHDGPQNERIDQIVA